MLNFLTQILNLQDATAESAWTIGFCPKERRTLTY